jgi:hypothetical protein
MSIDEGRKNHHQLEFEFMYASLNIFFKRNGGLWTRGVLCCLFACSFLLMQTAQAMAAYEKPPTLQAKSVLDPELIKGKNFTIKDQVRNDGLFNHYTVESKFGTFQADSTTDLKILVAEIDAIAAMKQVESEDTAVAGLKESGRKTVTGLKNLFHDPQATLEGAASGVGSLFNRAKETVGKREAGDAEDSKFEQLVGISKSKGVIASKYGVNVYSRNKVLQEELDRLGHADYLGGLGVGIASSFVPGVGGLVLTTSGTARLLNEAINTTPASELWLQNKNKLVAMGVDADVVELFLNNPSFSPAMSTILVTALEDMKGVQNRELFVKVALQAADPVMAETITRIAVMSAGYHKRIAPLKTFIPMARVTEGVRKDGARVVLLPVDYMTWSERIAAASETIGSEAKGKDLELWVLGQVSGQAEAALQKAGWKIHTGAGAKLLPVHK